MCYTEEQIKQFLEILHNYTKQTDPSLRALEDENRKVKCWNCQNSKFFLFIWVIAFVITVVKQMDMLWATMMLKIMIDYIFERRVFIRGSITIRKRLIKFLKDYT